MKTRGAWIPWLPIEIALSVFLKLESRFFTRLSMLIATSESALVSDLKRLFLYRGSTSQLELAYILLHTPGENMTLRRVLLTPLLFGDTRYSFIMLKKHCTVCRQWRHSGRFARIL